jgi:hypothetical protein
MRIRIGPKTLPQHFHIALPAVATVHIGKIYLFMVHLTTLWAAQCDVCYLCVVLL